MAPLRTVALALATLAAPLISAHPSKAQYATILERQDQLAEAYDYVIVGGGTSGLTVGDRLTENPKVSVLVIEYGVLDNDTAILTGGGGGGMAPQRMFSIPSLPMPGLNNRTNNVVVGKCVGGSSAVNGQVFLRGSTVDYDIWASLGGRGSSWGWSGLLPYFKKAIHFTPPSREFAEAMDVNYDPSYYGTSSTIYATYIESGSADQKLMHDAMASIPGVRIPPDQSSGLNGLSWFPTSMEPLNFTRSYARTGHWDNVGPARPNYHLITSSRVNKIFFNRQRVATGVQYVPVEGDGPTVRVNARKEVILAAGSVHTPQILQLSGIGPANLLRQANIPVLVDLPGVGQNFQDHSYIPFVGYTWGAAPNLTEIPLPPLRSPGGPNLAAFLGLPVVAPEDYNKIATAYEKQNPAKYLPPGTHPTVVAGYAAQQKLYAAAFRNAGFTMNQMMIGGGPGGSLQNLHPVSRGTLQIDPANPEAEPIIDYRAMSNPIDQDIMVANVKFMRRYMASPLLAEYQPVEFFPGVANVTSDAQIGDWVRQNVIPSVYHPVGTAAKMPRNLGGVVSEDLLVYGVEKLRIIDGSIFPTLVGATTSMTVYAIAEKAADLIKRSA